jgi:hypothetical protein
MEVFRPRYYTALSQQYSIASFVTPQVLSCLHSPVLHCLCCMLYNFVVTLNMQFDMAAVIDTFQFFIKLDKKKGTLQEDLHAFCALKWLGGELDQ